MSIIDTIDEAIREYNWNNDDEASKIIMDTYTYAILFEELGVAPDHLLDEYRGLKIKVDPDTIDICRIV